MSNTDKTRSRRRCSVAGNSDGYYTEHDDKDDESHKTPPKQQNQQQTVESIGRKSCRKVTPSKYLSDDFKTTVKRSNRSSDRKRIVQERSKYSDSDDSDSSEVFSKDSYNRENLFAENVDVEGKHMYGFNTPKKRGCMAVKALSTPKTPKQTSTMSAIGKSISKTPRRVRAKTKTEISKLLDSSESDFSPDESEYEPEESSDICSSEDSSDSDENVANLSNDENPKQGHRSNMKFTRSSSRAVVKNIDDYIPQSDGYFKTYASKKIVTSDHTLGRLKNPRLAQAELFKLLVSMKRSEEHERCLSKRLKEYKTYFNKWMHLLNEGFSILLYGLGSKRRFLQTFHSEVLQSFPVIVVNGFFPSLTIKDILDGITHEILELTTCSSNLHEIVDVIKIEFAKIPETHLFLIVHNIDGSMLRNTRAQNILSRLAAISNIHLIASLDHINSPLLWDHLKLSNFNFSWWNVTTMLPYVDETSFENSLLVHNSGDLALSSMNNVFQSLTTNARKIYLLIANQQLKNKNNTNYQGIAFKDLYWLSRESFYVSSDLALRAQLTEFLDHKLVKSRRTADGAEHLKIPITVNLLQQFYEQQTQ